MPAVNMCVGCQQVPTDHRNGGARIMVNKTTIQPRSPSLDTKNPNAGDARHIKKILVSTPKTDRIGIADAPQYGHTAVNYS